MNPKKSYKLTPEESMEVFHHCQRNDITIIGIGDFGKVVLCKLIKYHKLESDKNFRSNYVHISQLDYENMINCEKITDGIVLDTYFVLIVGDINDPSCLKIAKKLTNTFKEKFIVGFFAGIDNNFNILGIDAMVQLNGNSEKAFLALRLLPDIYTRCNPIGVDPHDIVSILKLGRNFKLLDIDVKKSRLSTNEKIHIKEATGGGGIFAVYGDRDLHMAWVDSIEKAISNDENGGGCYVFTPIIRPSKYDELKTVLLYSEKLITHLP